MILHITQPTRTSCGPTCVAMIAGVDVHDVLARLKDVKARKTHSDSTSVSNVRDLLKHYGFKIADLTMWCTVPPARRLQALDGSEFGLLKYHHRTPAGQFRQGWHWLVIAGGQVHDPSLTAPVDAQQWWASHSTGKTYLYQVSQ